MAAVLNGTTAYLHRTTNDINLSNAIPATWTGWVYYNSGALAAAENVAFLWGTEASARGYAARTTTGGVMRWRELGQEDRAGTSTTAPTEGKWWLYVITRLINADTRIRRLDYATGTIAAETVLGTINASSALSTQDVVVGAWEDKASRFHNGKLAYQRWYPNDLSDAQALELLTGDPTGAGSTPGWSVDLIANGNDSTANALHLTGVNVTFDADDPRTLSGGGGGSAIVPIAMHSYRRRRAA